VPRLFNKASDRNKFNKSWSHKKIIDTLRLGTREKLVLIKVAETYMVLGISPGSINVSYALDRNYQ